MGIAFNLEKDAVGIIIMGDYSEMRRDGSACHRPHSIVQSAMD